jgi:hypothetical protein
MFRREMLLLVASLIAASAVEVQAGCRCGRCNSNCNKVCKLVPDVKKVTTFKYCLECEDFCIPGRSKCLGWKQVCECGRPECVKCMQPTCACVRTKRKLMKMPVVEEHHGWKCVVVCKCCGCNHSTAAREATPAEMQLALEEADRQGLLLVNFEEPITVMIPDDESDVGAAATVPALFVAERKTESAPLAPVIGRATTAFGSLFGR